MLKVLFVASEAVPFSKTGGLADVAYALPKALRNLEVDARIMISKNFNLMPEIEEKLELLTHFEVEVGWRKQYVGIETVEYEGIPYYFVDNEYYFKRNNLYGYYDDGERYSYFSKAVLESIKYIDFIPDIIHVNDWHTGIIPLLLQESYGHYEKYKDIKTVLTIHNLKYQGIFGQEVLGDLLNLGGHYRTDSRIEFYGDVNYLKGGIHFANAITTVSETYAQEIGYEFFGERLDGDLRSNSAKLKGIVNGIDYDQYNPKTDPLIYKNYDGRSLKSKKDNKLYIQEKLKLPIQADVPMIGMVTRIVDMKGFDLIEHVFHEILSQDIQMVVLGTGSTHYENMLKYFASIYPNKLRVLLEFNNQMAHQIYASSDMYLMPSLFEPCGLSQLIAMRYGTIPIVRETGGLKDTVGPYNQFTGEGTGFTFKNYNAHEMLFQIQEALKLYYSEAETWKNMVKRAIKVDSSWKKSAKIYKKLYEGL